MSQQVTLDQLQMLLLLMMFLVVCFLQPGEAIRCVRCSSMDNPQCAKGGNLPVSNCEPNSKYCISYAGKPQGGLSTLVFRDCDTVDAGNKCTNKMLGGKRTRTCYHTCETDGCNQDDIGVAYSSQQASSSASPIQSGSTWIICWTHGVILMLGVLRVRITF